MRWKATTCHRIDLPCRFQLAGARDVSDIQSIPIGTTSSNSDSLEMTPEEVNRPCVSSRAALLDGELQQAWETPQQRIVFLLVAKETAHEMRRLPSPAMYDPRDASLSRRLNQLFALTASSPARLRAYAGRCAAGTPFSRP
jgi:hypothetical protein